MNKGVTVENKVLGHTTLGRRRRGRLMHSPCSSASLQNSSFAQRLSLISRQRRGRVQAQAHPVLTDAQVSAYESEGFLVLEDFATEEDVREMRERAEELVKTFDPTTISIFSTKKQEKTMNGQANFDSRQYFLDSASEVSFFFEEGAFDDEGQLVQEKDKSINKIGHALHDLDPAFRKFSRSEKMLGILKSLGYIKPTPVQSMYIFKQPKIGGEVVPHQDSTFLYTDPPSVIGIWIALEDATIQNGCLWGWKGSHKMKSVERRMLLNSEDEIVFDKDPVEHDLGEYTPIEVKAGTLVIFHGQFYHMSYGNKSSKSRHAYTFHVVEGADGFEWAENNWIRRKEGFPFEPLCSTEK